ncbi:MAG TPA: glycyl-radical enzyme activating protein [Firmicutes bacterium]|nr:glycyl-radical enzyme activating protein [Bacillota bacterium]
MKKPTGRVYDIQRFSVHDGPGIRTEVFLSGCPLSCLWCHSPESQYYEPKVAWFATRCIGTEVCGQCITACPQQAIALGERVTSPAEKKEIQLIQIDRTLCDDCGLCVAACPARALCLTTTEMTLDEVMAAIEKDRAYYEKSGGGVTISGGEPMVQHEFTLALLTACKEAALHTCLDTTGFAKFELYEKVLPFVDLFLYDLKHMDTKRSQRLTGVPNELILANARKLAAAGARLQIRMPIIPRLNDTEENLQATATFCRELGQAVHLVQILPYHRLGAVKYDRIGRKYKLVNVKAPPDERMEEIKDLLVSYGLKVKIH